MLQSIQFNGSGPPTYVYSKKATGATTEFYYVFAAETRGYKGRRESANGYYRFDQKKEGSEVAEQEEWQDLENRKSESLQEIYQREYGRRESFLWKQR